MKKSFRFVIPLEVLLPGAAKGAANLSVNGENVVVVLEKEAEGDSFHSGEDLIFVDKVLTKSNS